MRDDTKNWPPGSAAGDVLTASEVTVRKVALPRQTIVSGQGILGHFEQTLGPSVMWPDVALGPSYAIALRRDRVLLVNGPALADGWDDQSGHAVSDMTGGYTVFELDGEAVFDLLKRGADVNTAITSGSAARVFGGIGIILYRFEERNRLRMHVSTANQEALWRMLRSYLLQID